MLFRSLVEQPMTTILPFLSLALSQSSAIAAFVCPYIDTVITTDLFSKNNAERLLTLSGFKTLVLFFGMNKYNRFNKKMSMKSFAMKLKEQNSKG